MSNFDFTPQGWECPKCKRVYSPTTIMCVACPSMTGSITVGTSSTLSIHNFQQTEGTTSSTKCKICGLEEWQHPRISYT
jgi:hypothetical protein